MKKKRLFTLLLVAVSLFLAALPVQAAGQWVDLYPGYSESISNYQYGDKVSFYVNNGASNSSYGDIYWELVDFNDVVIDSGTVYNPWEYKMNQGDQYNYNVETYYSAEYPLDYSQSNRARLKLYCSGSTCYGDGRIDTY